MISRTVLYCIVLLQCCTVSYDRLSYSLICIHVVGGLVIHSEVHCAIIFAAPVAKYMDQNWPIKRISTRWQLLPISRDVIYTVPYRTVYTIYSTVQYSTIQ